MLAIFSRLGRALSLGARIRKQRARQSRNQVQRLEQLEDRTLLSAVTQYQTFLDTDWVSTGAGGFETFFEEPTGNADLTFSVPEGSTITNALLVWQGIDRTSYGGDGFYDNPQIQFGSNSVTGTLVGTNDTANWGAGNSQAFVADVTQFVTGSGTYSVAGLSGKVGHTANGVSLFVMYDDGDVTNNRDVNLLLGNESRANNIVSNIDYQGGSVSVQLIAADGQAFQDSGLQFNVRGVTGAPVGGITITDTDTLLDGNSVPVSQSSRDQVSAFWDMHTFDITSAFTGQSLPAAFYALEMTQLANSNDSLKWIGLAIDQPSDGSVDVNQPPVATALNFQVAEDTRLDGQLTGHDPDNDPIVAYEIGQQTSHGFLRLAASSGSFSYIPYANFNGVDTFTYRVFDGVSWSPYVTSSITVTPVNDAPTINGATVYVPENGSISYFVEIDDIDGDFLTAYVENQPANGTMTMRFDGTFTYTPNPGFTGQETVIVNVTDGQLVSEATITFIVQPVNQPPVSSNMAFTVNEDTNYFGSLIATDPDGDTLTYRVLSNVSNGTLTLNSNGTFQYRGDLNFNGTDSFTYVANDGNLDSAVGTVSITVTAQNDRPVATNQSIVLDEDTVYNGQLTGFDVDGDVISYRLAGSPANGTAVVNPDGTFTYTPITNFAGTDTFYFYVNDGQVDSFSGRVSVTVQPVNDAPIVSDDTYTVDEDDTLSISLTGMSFSFVSEPGEYVGGGQTLSYDRDNANFNSTYSTSHNYLSVEIRNPDNFSDYWSFRIAAPSGEELQVGTYTGATRYPFQDPQDPGLSITGQHRGYNTSIGEFTITQLVWAADGSLANFTATFWQASYEGAPRMTGEVEYNFDHGGTIGSVLDNDVDYDSSSMTAVLETQTEHGQLIFNSDGTFTYIPDADFHGVDTFTYRAFDGSLLSEPATVTINVTPENDTPIVTDVNFTGDEDTPIFGQLTASDVDGDILLFQVDEGPTQGNLTVNADGSFEYTPGPNFNGQDVFTYFVNDGTINSASASVTLTIEPVNDLPVVGDQTVSLNEDTSYSGAVSGNDVDGDVLNYSVAGSPAHGTLSLQSDGTYTYTPNANYNGPDSFTFIANDGTGNSNVGTVSFHVTPVNDAPVANAASFSGLEDNNVTGQLAGSDIDGDTLLFVLDQDVTNGTLQLNSDGSFTYTPAANFNGQDTFTFMVSDGIATSQAATVTLNVTAVNDPPVAADDLIALDEDSAYAGAVTGSDVDGDSLTYSVTSGPANGTLTFNADGTYIYEPDANYNGPDSFSFVASDGTATSNTATVTIQVLPVNDTPTATWTPVALEENSAVGTVAGNVVGADVDGDSLTYQIVAGNSGGAFTINESTGVITVADSSLLDFETTPTFSLTVQVSDPSGASVQLVATINLQDVDEIIPANIDVLPGDDTNVLNVADNKTVDVVISSTSELDIRDINIDSVELQIDGVLFSLTRNKRGVPRISYADTDGDGIDDQLTLTFDIVETGLTDGETTATLTGVANGQDFAGTDTVTIDTTSSKGGGKGGGGNGGGGNGGGKGKNK